MLLPSSERCFYIWGGGGGGKGKKVLQPKPLLLQHLAQFRPPRLRHRRASAPSSHSSPSVRLARHGHLAAFVDAGVDHRPIVIGQLLVLFSWGHISPSAAPPGRQPGRTSVGRPASRWSCRRRENQPRQLQKLNDCPRFVADGADVAMPRPSDSAASAAFCAAMATSAAATRKFST